MSSAEYSAAQTTRAATAPCSVGSSTMSPTSRAQVARVGVVQLPVGVKVTAHNMPMTVTVRGTAPTRSGLHSPGRNQPESCVRVPGMSERQRRILTTKAIALVVLGLGVLVSVVVFRRSTSPVPAPGPAPR